MQGMSKLPTFFDLVRQVQACNLTVQEAPAPRRGTWCLHSYSIGPDLRVVIVFGRLTVDDANSVMCRDNCMNVCMVLQPYL